MLMGCYYKKIPRVDTDTKYRITRNQKEASHIGALLFKTGAEEMRHRQGIVRADPRI